MSGEDVLPLVLIADDERSIAALVAEIVVQAGGQPRVATHGRQALDLARERWPAVVITDLMMPHLDGAGLIARLREEAVARGKAAPAFILMTAASLQYARAAEADVVLRKPFDITEMEALLQHFLEQGGADAASETRTEGESGARYLSPDETSQSTLRLDVDNDQAQRDP